MPDTNFRPPLYSALSSRLLGISELGKPLSPAAVVAAASGIKNKIIQNQEARRYWEEFCRKHPNDPASAFFAKGKICLTGK